MILVRKTANTLSVVDTILIRGFKFEELVTMLSIEDAIHSCIRCFAPSTCLRNQRFRKHDFPMLLSIVTMLSAKGTIHKLTILYISWFRCWKHRNHVEHRRCDTFRVSDTLCLQHAYEIKDFGSTIPSLKNL